MGARLTTGPILCAGAVGALALGAAIAPVASAHSHRRGGHGQRRGNRERTRRLHVGAPSVSIGSPVNGADYAQGQDVAASYTCTASAPAVVSSCSGPVPDGAPLPTATKGTHSFTVSARDDHGGTATRTVVYIVSAAHSPAAVSSGTPPVLSSVRQSAPVWREGAKPIRISAARVPTGTTFAFALNEPAAITFSFVPRGATRGESFSFPGHGGTNRVDFDGRLTGTQKLSPGRYTLTISATDTAGQNAPQQQLEFTITG
jgi:hypothetical protein